MRPSCAAAVMAQPGSARWVQSGKRHWPSSARISGKHWASPRGSSPHNPTSLKPGVSTSQPPIGSDTMRALTVVCLPRPVRSETSPVRSTRPGRSALSRLDLPAPLGPATTVACPGSHAAMAASPSRVRTLTGSTS